MLQPTLAAAKAQSLFGRLEAHEDGQEGAEEEVRGPTSSSIWPEPAAELRDRHSRERLSFSALAEFFHGIRGRSDTDIRPGPPRGTILYVYLILHLVA